MAAALMRRLPHGSTLYSMIWSIQITPALRPVYQLRASALRTSGNGSSGSRKGWRTPNAEDGPHGGQEPAKRAAGGHAIKLTDEARLAGWPTPTTRDWKDGSEQKNVPLNSLLGREVWLAGWGTPNASAPGGTPEQALARKEGLPCGQSVTTLDHQVQLAGWPTPQMPSGTRRRSFPAIDTTKMLG